jgi:hypothetical protein
LDKVYDFLYQAEDIPKDKLMNNMDELNEDFTESALQFKKQKTKIRDVEVKIPEMIIPPALSMPYNHLKMMVFQECEKYNSLLLGLKERLRLLIKCLDGETLLNSTMESEFRDLIKDVTPPKWLQMSYPSSGSLPGFLVDL